MFPNLSVSRVREKSHKSKSFIEYFSSKSLFPAVDCKCFHVTVLLAPEHVSKRVILSFPWEATTSAFFRKYPNPFSTHVLSSDCIFRSDVKNPMSSIVGTTMKSPCLCEAPDSSQRRTRSQSGWIEFVAVH